ncbi:MAG: SGNH/GDSL hydrolase family protein [Chitinophagales bacterium]|nr:SGNH/GDSL hydrolase family protein [Chitinophagales bacterium]
MKTTLYGITIFSILAVLPKKESISLNTITYGTNSTQMPPPAPLGTIYSKNNWTDAADFITNGNTTATPAAGYINISSSTKDDWNNTIHITGYQTKLEKWRFKLRFKIINWAGDSYGLGFGLKSANANVQNDVMGFVQTTSSGIGGLYILKSNRIIVTTGPSLGVALNDTIDMEGIFYDSVFHFTARNITSGITANVSYTFASNGSTHVVPNTSHFSLMELGGTHQIQQIEISSEELTDSRLVTVGDSKTIGYFSNTFAGRYGAQLNRNYAPALINAGGADRVTNVLNRKDELIRLSPDKFLLSIGSNDIRFGSSLAQLQANYDSLVRILQATGASVYHIVLPEDYTKPLGVNLLAFKNWVAATYPANYINVWDSLSASNLLKGIYDTGDGVHLNQAANDKIYEAIIASNKLGSGVTLPVKLLSFTAKKINSTTGTISWETDPSFQAETYEVLKSTDGIHFESLSVLSSTLSTRYNCTDNTLSPGRTYYKLKITERSGSISFSNIISIQNKEELIKLTAFQNQGGSKIIFNITASKSIIINWQLVLSNGQKLLQHTEQLHKGSNSIKVDLPVNNKGVHYLKISTTGNTDNISFPFIK